MSDLNIRQNVTAPRLLILLLAGLAMVHGDAYRYYELEVTDKNWVDGWCVSVIHLYAGGQLIQVTADGSQKPGTLWSTPVDVWKPAVREASNHAQSNVGGSEGTWGNSNLPSWLRVDLGASTCVDEYRVIGCAGQPHYRIHMWKFLGSNDNSNWVTLDTQDYGSRCDGHSQCCDNPMSGGTSTAHPECLYTSPKFAIGTACVGSTHSLTHRIVWGTV